LNFFFASHIKHNLTGSMYLVTMGTEYSDVTAPYLLLIETNCSL